MGAIVVLALHVVVIYALATGQLWRLVHLVLWLLVLYAVDYAVRRFMDTTFMGSIWTPLPPESLYSPPQSEILHFQNLGVRQRDLR